MLQRFDIDTRSVGQGPPDNWRDIVFADGSYQDEWGVVRSRPAGCLYYDLTRSPFAGEASVADLDRHPWPDPHDPGRCRGLKEEARRRAETDYAIALNMPGGVVTQAQFMRGFEDWFADLIADPTFYHALLDRITDLWIEMAKDELDAAGDSVDFCFFGDDVAFQDGPMMSMELYRKMVKPYHARVFSYIKSRSSAKILYHTCGSVAHLIPDRSNWAWTPQPHQVSARDGHETLKREFSRISASGAALTQQVLLQIRPGRAG
jgi:uroporphyrinogen decarboxylase